MERIIGMPQTYEKSNQWNETVGIEAHEPPGSKEKAKSAITSLQLLAFLQTLSTLTCQSFCNKDLIGLTGADTLPEALTKLFAIWTAERLSYSTQRLCTPSCPWDFNPSSNAHSSAIGTEPVPYFAVKPATHLPRGVILLTCLFCADLLSVLSVLMSIAYG